jgi:hypothetical protein
MELAKFAHINYIGVVPADQAEHETKWLCAMRVMHNHTSEKIGKFLDSFATHVPSNTKGDKKGENCDSKRLFQVVDKISMSTSSKTLPAATNSQHFAIRFHGYFDTKVQTLKNNLATSNLSVSNMPDFDAEPLCNSTLDHLEFSLLMLSRK